MRIYPRALLMQRDCVTLIESARIPLIAVAASRCGATGGVRRRCPRGTRKSSYTTRRPKISGSPITALSNHPKLRVAVNKYPTLGVLTQFLFLSLDNSSKSCRKLPIRKRREK
ncbi:hypothetical protein V1478_006712 [Vespula squamosa]|uniref:Uncharacterized protein n=1 Tax=Vespula squamosa TaxID=30214 RepID=A0ABD2B0P4_VESSQ